MRIDSLLDRYSLVNKFINQSIYSLEMCQKYSTSFEHFRMENERIRMFDHIRFKGNYMDESRTFFILMDRALLPLSRSLQYKRNKHYKYTVEQYENLVKRRILVLINGLKVPDDNVKIVFDMNKTYIMVKENDYIIKNIVERIDILSINARIVGETNLNRILKDDKEELMVFNKETGELVKYFHDDDQTVIVEAENNFEKEVYHVPYLRNYVNHDKENYSYFQVRDYIHLDNLLVFKNNKCEDNVTSFHNSIFQIDNYDDKSDYQILVFDVPDVNQRNETLDEYIKKNPNLLRYYVNGTQISDHIYNIDYNDYKNILMECDGALCNTVDEIITNIVKKDHNFIERIIKNLINITDTLEITVDEKFLTDYRVENVNQNIYWLDRDLHQTMHYIELEDDKFFTDVVFINDEPVVIEKKYFAGFTTFIYIPNALSVGDKITIKRKDIVIEQTGDYNDDYEFIHDGEDEVIDNVKDDTIMKYDFILYHITEDEIYDIVDFKHHWDGNNLVITNIHDCYKGKLLKLMINGGEVRMKVSPKKVYIEEDYKIYLDKFIPFYVDRYNIQVFLNDKLYDADDIAVVHATRTEESENLKSQIILKNMTINPHDTLEIIINNRTKLVYRQSPSERDYIFLESLSFKKYEPTYHKIYVDGHLVKFEDVTILSDRLLYIKGIKSKRVEVFEDIIFESEILDYIREKMLGDFDIEAFKRAFRLPYLMTEKEKNYVYLKIILDKLRNYEYHVIDGEIKLVDDDGLVKYLNGTEFVSMDLFNTFSQSKDEQGISELIDVYNHDIPEMIIENMYYYERLVKGRHI